jgi:hypothetical protein
MVFCDKRALYKLRVQRDPDGEFKIFKEKLSERLPSLDLEQFTIDDFLEGYHLLVPKVEADREKDFAEGTPFPFM